MENRTTKSNITKLTKNEIFVFGSNAQGNHAGGAAKLAKEKFKAIEGVARGLTGKCYAIDTMSGIDVLREQIEPFFSVAKVCADKIFLVTELGCGIAGYTPEQIAPLFNGAHLIENIFLPESFWKLLKPTVKGYKVFNPDFSCRGFQFSENSEFTTQEKIVPCQSGFHFCTQAQDCFSYYNFNSDNIVCEVEALGDFLTHSGDSKIVTNHLKIGRRLTWQEVLVVANSGSNNTGHSNSGYRNSGDSNSGDSNSGDSNSGDSNSGSWNSGSRNSGDSNSGYRNSGAFCVDENPILFLFDKPTKTTVKEWENSKAVELMRNLDFTIWVNSSIMSDDEKKGNPSHETTGGFLRVIPIKDAWGNFWNNLTAANKKVFTSLENFDSVKFEQITGIKI